MNWFHPEAGSIQAISVLILPRGQHLLSRSQRLRFNVGVREAVGVHGGQVGAAHDAHHQTGLLGVVLEGDHDATALLQGLVLRLVDLPKRRRQKDNFTKKNLPQLLVQ